MSRRTIDIVGNGVFIPWVLLAPGRAEALDAKEDALFFIKHDDAQAVAADTLVHHR